MVVDKLKTHGITTDVAHVYTPCLACMSYLEQHYPQQKPYHVYLIGQIGLKSAFWENTHFLIDDQKPDFVIVGMDTDLTYHKIRVAVKAIRQGARFIGTNADLNLPIADELLPGNGSQCAMIAAATGVKPFYIGKPSSVIIDMALQKFHFSKDETLIVGDNYQTDIQAGINSHVDTLLTLTGVTRRSELVGKTAPTHIVDDLSEWQL